jgi:hypothetical protein
MGGPFGGPKSPASFGACGAATETSGASTASASAQSILFMGGPFFGTFRKMCPLHLIRAAMRPS